MKLTNIDAVSLLDKRGYLTICINQKTDGRMYLRLQEGIRDWFYHIQSSVYECKRRRKFWVKGPSFTGQANNRLARLYGENLYTKSEDMLHSKVQLLVHSSNMMHSSFLFSGSDNNIAEEDMGQADDEEDESDNNNNVPRGINRLSCKMELLIISKLD